MNIAILKNDSVIEQLRDEFPDYDQMVVNWLNPLTANSKSKVRFTIYDMQKREQPSFDHNIYISTGSRKSVYEDEDWIHHYRDIVWELHEKRLFHLGICFGHQMIASVLGGEVGKASEWGVGVHHWQAEGDLLGKSSLALCVSHQDQVITLTPEMKLFLKSDFCPKAGFTVGQHIMGIQGHPEFSTHYVEAIMSTRKSIYLEETYHRGIASLDNPTDEVYFLSVIKDFFNLA